MPKSGLLPDVFDPRDVFEDELAGEALAVALPPKYRTEDLVFEPQGSWPFCASFATTKMVEHALAKLHGDRYELSQPHLFFHSGGGPGGSTFRGNLDTARNLGTRLFQDFPMPKDLYDLESFPQVREQALKLKPDPTMRIVGYVRITPNRDAIKEAIFKYGMVMVGVKAAGGYWGDRAKRPASSVDDHATLLVGWEPDGAWVAFDSLQPSRGFTGYHTLDKDYEFHSVYAVTELPKDWKEQRDKAREAPSNNAARYGKPRDFPAEVKFAAEMLEAFKKFNNQSVLEAAGRFWEQLIRAGVYGGYSLSYRKWGIWQPGDLINFVYHYRRTGKQLFNLDKPRDQQ